MDGCQTSAVLYTRELVDIQISLLLLADVSQVTNRDIQMFTDGQAAIIASFEPPSDKTNKMACAPSEDSDQPGHPLSLIRVFAVRMRKAWVLIYPLNAQRRL